MENIIIAAIKAISFNYNGYSRTVEPHVYGISDGVYQFLGYQISGYSSKGGLPDWWRFDLSSIRDLQILNESFPGRRSFPSGKHSRWDQLILIVE